jgi:hypothetical protein
LRHAAVRMRDLRMFPKISDFSDKIVRAMRFKLSGSRSICGPIVTHSIR